MEIIVTALSATGVLIWQERSGAQIDHLQHLMTWKARVDARPAVKKALKDEADIVALHERMAA